MAHKQKGLTVRPNVWWKHLGNYFGRHFWKRQRKADEKMCTYEDWFQCRICFSTIKDERPNVGESVTCGSCGTEAYGTYDENGEYMIEWYELEHRKNRKQLRNK